MLSERYETKSRILAKVLRDLLRTETFDTLADLTDALKARSAQLKIAWTADELNDAFTVIDSNTPLIPERYPKPTNPKHIERPEESFDPPKDEARAVVEKLRQQLGTPAPVKAMPQVELLTPRDADRAKALEMVLKELEATAARCDALEKETASDES
jgi:hypothetical protein